MKNLFFLSLGLVLVVGSIFIFLTRPIQTPVEVVGEFSKVRVGEAVINVEVARDLEERARGLSGRETLPEGSGMVLIFDTSTKHGIWMREMRFPIDIIWIAQNRTVTDIAEQISPDTYPQILYPMKDSKYVLEIPAGYAEMVGIDIGDVVFFE